jgi:23S rRNA (cytosine1962-C5)-methyltransferase
LPGVIVDRYGDHVVLQDAHARDGHAEAFDRRSAAEVVGFASSIVERMTRQCARGRLECAPVLWPATARRVDMGAVDGPRSNDLLNARDGFYLDQCALQLPWPQPGGRRVLDCFTSQGPFALACARAGAATVIAVEASADSLASARANAERNATTSELAEEDVFAFLRSAEKAEAEYDLIILDPPSFTKTKGGLHNAMRGYRELHVRAFKLLSKDGLLATFSCSHHVSEQAFAQTISDALVDARRSARRLRRFEQALDHPVLPTLPETEYFKGLLLEMMPGR